MIQDDIQELVGELTNVEPLSGEVEPDTVQMSGDLNNATVETSNYNKLEYKPTINNVVLQGNMTLDDLDVQQSMDYLTNMDIERLIGD